MLDAIVVGSGPAGTFTAHGLRGRKVLVLDVGRQPPGDPGLDGNLHELRKSTADLFEPLIGTRFESLRNVHQPAVSLKLKSPFMAYVIEDWEQLSPVEATGFAAVMSFAQGGLANAWGAGVYRFDGRDLAGFPIGPADLEPYYDELTRHIGICGTSDDLLPWFGGAQDLMEPLPPSQMSRALLAGYRRRQRFMRGQGIAIGRPRLAVLTRSLGRRAAYRNESLELFKPRIEAIYNPVYTLDDLVKDGQVRYERDVLVTRFQEADGHVVVEARNTRTGALESHSAKLLFLAAGALNSAKIALASSADFASRLPLLDNPMSIVPLIRPGRIGSPPDPDDSSLAQLNVVYEGPAAQGTVQGSFYGAAGPLRSDVLFDVPLAVSSSAAWVRALSPAMGVLMLFYPARPRAGNHLRLLPDGALEIRSEAETLGTLERHLLRAFRRLGFWGLPQLCQYPPMGSSMHYAGTLPMKAEPGPHQSSADGRLHGTRRVFVTDGACFSALPAKNLTFTIMANALRIARKAGARLDSGADGLA